MKLWKPRVSLAKKPQPNVTGEEQGSSGRLNDGYFQSELGLSNTRTPTIRQIMRMLDEDGTAAGLYSVMTFPVLAIDWHLNPDPDDVVKDKDGNTTHPQADFVESCLRDPLHKGGMSTPFSLVLSDILLGIAQGYRIFEIVYKLNNDGMIVFQKVTSREPWDVTIRTDDTGGFNGFEQMVSKNGSTQKVTIELPYAFLYTYRKDRHKLKGLSAFRSAFYHYDKKHRLYYLANQQAQTAAVNDKILKAPDGAEKTDRDENLRAVDKMANRSSIALPAGWDLDIKTPGKSVELLPYLDHHNVEMARSVLADGQMLGTMSDSKGGSYSLADSKMDTFMYGERYIMNSIEEHVTSFLISKLIDYNFAVPRYPTFAFNDMTDDTASLLLEAFKSLISKGAVPKWVANGISDKVAESAKITRPEADGVEVDDNDYIGITNTPSQPGLSRSSKKKVSLAKGDWWRELTAAEAKVQFAKIDAKANTEEELMLKDVKPVIADMASDATKRLKPLLDDKGIKALDGFTLNFGSDLQKVFNTHMLNMYSDSKTAAADEIKKPAPGNKQVSKDLVSQHAQSIVDKQQGDLLFNIKTIVTDAVRKNLLDKTELSVGKVIADVADMFDEFFDAKEDLTVSSLISFALNLGRDDVFKQYDDDVYAYQYSAILDESVCAICEDLDSSVVKPEVYFSTIWMPPIHFNCRCIWVAIMDDEEDKPEFQDLPETPGGASAPSL